MVVCLFRIPGDRLPGRYSSAWTKSFRRREDLGLSGKLVAAFHDLHGFGPERRPCPGPCWRSAT